MATQPISIQGECAALLSGLDGGIAALEKLPKLTDEERAVIAAWVTAGAPAK